MSDQRLVIDDGEVDTSLVAGYEATRRDAVRRGLIAGGAAIAATMVPTLLRVSQAFGQNQALVLNDRSIIEGAVGLEQSFVVVYETAVKRKLLGPLTPIAELFARQEQQHVDALSKALQGLGGAVPKPPNENDIAGLTKVTTKQQMLNFVIEIENMAVAAYVHAAKTVQDTKLLSTIVEIVPNEGQHLSVLKQALGADPVPTAMPSGSAKG